MDTFSDSAASVAVIGVGATALIDVWAAVRARYFGIPSPSYGLVGRWLGHLARGQLTHDNIGASPAVRGERAIGWAAHYLIGIAFAAVLVLAWGLDWVRQPTLAPALIVGIGTVAAPFLVMHPGMGMGIAASRTQCPPIARLRSVMTHAVFGLGLYAAGLANSLL